MSCQENLKKDVEGVTTNGKKIVQKIEPGEDNPRNSEGDFIELRNGKILFVYSYFTGNSTSDHAPAYLVGRYSINGGDSWTEAEVIIREEGDMNVMSVSLLRLQNGEIALFYARKNSRSDCIPMMRISNDEAKTWGKPVPVITDKEGYFVLNNDRVVQLNNGRLIVPVSLHKTPDSDWSSKGRLWSYRSDDNGRTWKVGSEVPNPENVILQEPGVVELKSGRILMFIRTTEGVQYLSFSDDNGESWSPARTSNIPSPRSPASIERIPSTGDLLLVWNYNADAMLTGRGKRTPFNSAISKDEGETWTNIRTIHDDPEGWYCYTAIQFLKGEVLLGYCAGNRPEGTGLAIINITKLDLDWIYRQNGDK